jgi:hypothetical protein
MEIVHSPPTWGIWAKALLENKMGDTVPRKIGRKKLDMVGLVDRIGEKYFTKPFSKDTKQHSKLLAECQQQ